MGFGASPKDQDQIPLSAAWSETNNAILAIRGIREHTDSNGNTTLIVEIGAASGDIADGAIVALGTQADGAWSGSGSGTLIAIAKKIESLLAGTLAVSGSFTASNPSVGTDGSAAPSSSTQIGATDGTNLQPLKVDGSGFLKVNVAAGGGSGGTSSSYGSSFPATGTAVGASDGTNMQALQVESSSNKNLRVGLYSGSNEATVTGSNALKVDGSAVTQPVSGTVTANAGSGTFTNQQSNITADYDSGAGTQNVTMFGIGLPASGGAVAGGTSSNPLRTDPTGTTTQPVSGTVTANIGTSGSLALESGGNLATLAGAVSSSKMQANVSQINGVTPSMGNGASGTGVQRVTIANDSTGQVALAAGSNTIGALTANQSVNVAQINGSTTATAASGVQKVGVVGNAGATVDSTVGAGTAPTNAIAVAAVYNSTAPAPTNGQAMSIQADQAGNTRMFPGVALATLSAWNNGTSLNATQTIFLNSGCEAVLVQLTQTSTLTAGAVTFEVTYDGTNWSTIPANNVLDPTSTTFAQISLPYTVQASTNKQFLLNMNGAQGLRAKLSTQITGSGSVTPNYALLPFSPADGVIAYSPTASNFNANVTVNAVTAALSQTNQVPVCNSATQGKLTLSGTLTANSDNSITFSGGASVARRIRIQNESSGTIYWETDTTASAGSPSLAAPAANAVSVEWLSIQCTTLHIFIPSGGTTTLNGSGGVKVTAYA